MIEILLDCFAEPRDGGEAVSYVTESFEATGVPNKKNLKRRIEVKTRQLTLDDRHLFDAAKRKEWHSWLEKEAVEVVKARSKISRSHILKARWVLTWKNVGTENNQRQGCVRLGFKTLG